MRLFFIIFFLIFSPNTFATSFNEKFYLNSGAFISTKISLPQLDLTTSSGKQINTEDLKGRWKLIYFGYSKCPVICPKNLKLLNKVKSYLSALRAKNLDIYFVSLDNKNDSIPSLKNFLSEYKNIVGLKVSDNALASLKASLHVKSFTHNTNDKYTVINHTTSFLLVAPNNNYICRFDPPFDIKLLATDLELITSNYKGEK